MVRGGFVQVYKAGTMMAIQPKRFSHILIIILMTVIAWLWGFSIGKMRTAMVSVVQDTVIIVDTFRISDTVFIYQGGELRLVKCDTAFIRWENRLGHLENISWGGWHSWGVHAPPVSPYSANFGVGVGVGYYKEPFGFLSWRFGRLQGWVKPYKPYSAGFSYMLLLW